MPRFKDSAIVIRVQEWSQTSQVVTLLAAGRGKLRGLAKGSRRLAPSSMQRFSGGFDLLTIGEVVAVTRAGRELATLTEWDLQEPLPRLRRDLEALQASYYAADVVNALLADEDPHPRTFAVLAGFLRQMGAGAGARGAADPGLDEDTKTRRGGSGGAGDAVRGAGPGLVEDNKTRRGGAGLAAAMLALQWAVLEDVGLRPELDLDVREPGVALPKQPTYTFDPGQGGLTAQDGEEAWRVRRATVELLRRVRAGDPLADADAAAVARANRLLCVYIRHVVGRELATMGWVLNSRGPGSGARVP